jgi:hypothetical protein
LSERVSKTDQQRIQDLVNDLARTLTKRQRLVAQLQQAMNVGGQAENSEVANLDTVQRQLESIGAAQRVLLNRLIALVPPGHPADQ